MLALLSPGGAGAGTIVYERSVHDPKLERTRGEIWAMNENGSGRRLLAHSRGDLAKNGPSRGYYSFTNPSVAPLGGRAVIFEAQAVGHSAIVCDGFCTNHFGFHVTGVRRWRGGQLANLTPRPQYCFNCSTFWDEPEVTNGGRWVGWYQHYQGGTLSYNNDWVEGGVGGGNPRLLGSPCPNNSSLGPIASHLIAPNAVAFVACRNSNGARSIYVTTRELLGKLIARVRVDDNQPAVGWTALGRVIVRVANADAPENAGLYLYDANLDPPDQNRELMLREPLGVVFTSPTTAAGGRIVFAARQGSGAQSTTDIWAISSDCRGCTFPADATRLTRDGVSRNPDHTGVKGLESLPRIKQRRLRLRRGAVRVRVGCPLAGGPCRGRLLVRRGGRLLARGRFKVPPGKARRVRAKLTPKGRRIARGGKPRLRVLIRTPRGNRVARRVRPR